MTVEIERENLPTPIVSARVKCLDPTGPDHDFIRVMRIGDRLDFTTTEGHESACCLMTTVDAIDFAHAIIELAEGRNALSCQ